MKHILLITALFMLQALNLSATEENVTIEGATGKLSATIQCPEISEKQKIPLVVLCHGFGGNKNGKIEKMLADELEKNGIASIRFDFNGHGESEGKMENMTVANEIKDAIAVVEYAHSLNYVKSISLSGHSQGGVVAGMAAAALGKKEIKALCLMAPAAVLREDAIRGCTFGAKYDPHNPPEVVKLPRGNKIGREYIKIAFMLDIFGISKDYTGRVCLIHGTGDKIVPFSYSEHYKEIYGVNAELNILENYDHSFSQDLPNAVRIATEFFKHQLL